MVLRPDGSVTIEPREGIARLDTLELQRGRIVARINASTGVPACGLGPGINYLWVVKQQGSWSAFVYPFEDPTASPTEVSATLRLDSGPREDWALIRSNTSLGAIGCSLWIQCSVCCICTSPVCSDIFRHPMGTEVRSIVDTLNVIRR